MAPDGNAVGDHIASLRRQLGKPKAEPPPLAEALRYIWNTFVELHTARSSGGFGPAPISYSEIMSYSRLMACDLSPWEVKVIRALDSLYIETSSQSEEAARANG